MQQFGAAVGATNTNILVGAPGNNGGEGEVYEFEGDTTQSTFGNLLLDIPNPDPQPASSFGAAVAGIGNNVIVGAPTVDLAGAVGGVFDFDGTTGTEITSIASPSTTPIEFGCGGGIRRDEYPDRVAWRHGRCGCGLSLRSAGDARGRDAAHDVRSARRRWRQLRCRGRRYAEHGIDRHPGAFLGTSDAGAAYLFDADPSSPTFGNAISAVQEPTPTSGDAFGTSVGFDIGALIVGAAGPIGSGVTGAEAVDLYQPGAQIAVSSVTTYLTPAPQRLGDLERHVHGRQSCGNPDRHDQLG